MKNVIKKVVEWFKENQQRDEESKKATHEKELRTEAYENIQVKEFRGRICLSYKGMPFIDVERLKVPTTAALEEMRSMYLELMRSK